MSYLQKTTTFNRAMIEEILRRNERRVRRREAIGGKKLWDSIPRTYQLDLLEKYRVSSHVKNPEHVLGHMSTKQLLQLRAAVTRQRKTFHPITR